MPGHILDASGRLTERRDEIAKVVDRSLRAFTTALGLEPESVDVVVQHMPHRTIPELGIGGFNRDEHTIFISLDPDHPELHRNLEPHLRRAIAHELHHAARRRGPGYGRTLFAALVSEGLADHFAAEMTGLKPPPWAALTDAELNDLEERARADDNATDYGHRLWFHGERPETIPRWAGYTLGYQIVGRYLALEARETPASLVMAPPDRFWRVG